MNESHSIVVSAFGRGHWLAAELVRRGLPASLIDVTESLGRWTPDDWEGPFGFFRHDDLLPSQMERLAEDEPLEELKGGFCLWLKSGPLEMKSSLTKHRLSSLGLSPAVEDYLMNFKLKSSRVHELDFKENWLARFAVQLNSPIYFDHGQNLQKQTPMNLYSPFSVRQATRPGFDKSLAWCKNIGVKVFEKAEVHDFSLGDKGVVALEVKAETTELVRGDQVIWMLSSEETEYMNSKLMNYVFPKGSIEPEWCWVRYRCKLTASPVLHELPIHAVIIGELEFAWAHENLLILQKTISADQYDLWFRVPNTQRFQMNYHKDVIEKAMTLLQKNIPLVQIEIVSYPQEYQYSYDEVGPSRFPLFSERDLKKLVTGKSKNIYYDGPEFWPYLGWNGQLRNQQQIVEKIHEQWLKAEELRKKKGDR